MFSLRLSLFIIFQSMLKVRIIQMIWKIVSVEEGIVLLILILMALSLEGIQYWKILIRNAFINSLKIFIISIYKSILIIVLNLTILSLILMIVFLTSLNSSTLMLLLVSVTPLLKSRIGLHQEIILLLNKTETYFRKVIFILSLKFKSMEFFTK